LKARKDHTVMDAAGQVLRCTRCGEEVPIPMGVIEWFAGYIRAFSKAHASCTVATGTMPRCWLSKPVPKSKRRGVR
jgi:hypothetical protein